MIVRCGRCRAELEVTGPGEFICPQCGTRNAVRGAPQQAPALELPDLGAPSPPSGPSPGVQWITCPACAYRFALGEVEEAPCPSCGERLGISDKGVTALGDQPSSADRTA